MLALRFENQRMRMNLNRPKGTEILNRAILIHSLNLREPYGGFLAGRSRKDRFTF